MLANYSASGLNFPRIRHWTDSDRAHAAATVGLFGWGHAHIPDELAHEAGDLLASSRAAVIGVQA